MKVKELTDWLGGNFPAAVAEDWDNVGLLTGDDESEVKHVFLALDLTEAVLDEAVQAGADMIVTHHPMIFSGIKKINNTALQDGRLSVWCAMEYLIMRCTPTMIFWEWQI